MTYPILQTNPPKPLPFCWVIAYPTTGGILGTRIAQNLTATRVDAYTSGGTSCTFNIEQRSTIGTTGTNIMTSDMVADSNGEIDTTLANPNLVEGNWLYVDISAVSGAVEQVVIVLTY